MLSIEVQKSYAVGERNFSGVDLRGQDLSGLDLSDADFSDADLRGTSFRNATLRNTLFCNSRCGILGHKFMLMCFLYVIIALSFPILYSSMSLTFVNGHSVFLRSVVYYISMLIILLVFKSLLKGPIAIFVDYSVDAVVFSFATMIFFVGYSEAINNGRRNFLFMYEFICVLLYGALLLVPVSFLINRLLSTTDGHRSSWTGMWKWFGTDFRGAVLTDADFSGAELRTADFRGSVLLHTCFYEAVNVELATFGDAAKRVINNDLALKLGHRFSDYSTKSTREIITHQSHSNIMARKQSLRLLYLADMNLCFANLENADLSGSFLNGSDLSQASLRRVDCHNTSLVRTILREVDFFEAVLVNADLTQADLRGASLKLTNLEGANLTDARVDIGTYTRSEWTAEKVAELIARGAWIAPDDLQQFPSEVRERLRPNRGLLLSFSTLLSDMDRDLISTLIFTTLGANTDCRLTEYREQGRMALVLINGSQRMDLERVAEALYDRVWQQAEAWHAEKKAADPAGHADLMNKLDELRSRLEKMDLRWQAEHPSRAAAPPVLEGIADHAGPLAFPPRFESEPLRLFIAHVPADQRFVDEFIDAIAPLRHQGIVEVWHQGLVIPGGNLAEARMRALAMAHIAVFMVSRDLIASELFHHETLQPAVERHQIGLLHIIPVLLRPAHVKNTFFSCNHLKPLPSNLRPISKWTNRDEAWAKVSEGIQQVVEALQRSRRTVEKDDVAA